MTVAAYLFGSSCPPRLSMSTASRGPLRHLSVKQRVRYVPAATHASRHALFIGRPAHRLVVLAHEVCGLFDEERQVGLAGPAVDFGGYCAGARGISFVSEDDSEERLLGERT